MESEASMIHTLTLPWLDYLDWVFIYWKKFSQFLIQELQLV